MVNTPDRAALSPETLTLYEQLRRGVLDPTSVPSTDEGLALLMRRGMAAWAKQQAALTPTLLPLPPSAFPPSHPAQTQLTSLLVSMLIGSLERQEVSF